MESTRPSGIPKPSGMSRIPTARSTRPATSDLSSSLKTSQTLPPAPPTGRFDVKDINLSASTASALPKPVRALQSTRAPSSSLPPSTIKSSPKKSSIPHASSNIGSKISPASSPTKPSSPSTHAKASHSPVQSPAKAVNTIQKPPAEENPHAAVPTPRLFETPEDLAIFDSLAKITESPATADPSTQPSYLSPDSLTALWEEDLDKLTVDYRFSRDDRFSYMVYEKVYGYSEYLKAIDAEFEKNIDVFGTKLVFDEDLVV
eukprot:gene33194-40161_t